MFNTLLTSTITNVFYICHRMKQVVTFAAIFLLLSSCKQNEKDNGTFFGGEILNPKSDHVLLMQQNEVLDTIFLDQKNVFGKTFYDLKPGLYSFKHGNEFQYIYLEPKDSINVRLNTWDFDESLVFDGKGSEKSEFLLDLFLNNEREYWNYYSYYKLPEKEFNGKFNSSLNRNISQFKKFAQSNPQLSTDFLHLAEGASTFTLYSMKELYPMVYNRHYKTADSLVLSPEYYNYRDNINLNDEILADYYAYQNYLSAHIYNDVISKNNFDISEENLKQQVLQSIVENVNIESLKNSLLYQEISKLIFNPNSNINPAFLNIFYENCTDDDLVKNIKETLRLKETIENYDLIKDIKFVDRQDKIKTLDQLIGGNPALVLFSKQHDLSNEALDKRLDYLSKKFPDVIIVNLHFDTGDTEISYHNTSNFNYKLIDPKSISSYVSDKFPRSLIINKKGEIINNFSLLYDYSLEKELKKLLD